MLVVCLRWHKSPADLHLRALAQGTAVGKCYMKELGSCGGVLSREHLFSESVALILQGDGDFSVSGLPWQAAGEEKLIGIGSFTTHCLCQTHNSALSPLDAAAQRFFGALKSCLEQKTTSARYVVSGHNIERWLLKTAKAVAASGNFAQGRERLSGAFANDLAVVDMLDDPTRWPEGTGLYCLMNTGHVTQNHNRFQIQPYTNNEGEIGGLSVNILGLGFYLRLERLDLSRRTPELQRAKYRPGQIAVSFPPSARNVIDISWEDERQHEPVTMTRIGP